MRGRDTQFLAQFDLWPAQVTNDHDEYSPAAMFLFPALVAGFQHTGLEIAGDEAKIMMGPNRDAF